MNTLVTRPAAISVNYPPYAPSEAETKQLKTTSKHLAHLEELLANVVDLKKYSAKLTEDLLAGRTNIESVGPMLWAVSDTSRRQEMAAALRGVLKAQMRETLATVQPVFDARQKARADHVKGLAAKAEKAERKSVEEAGLHPDEFVPSNHLAGLRETYSRLLEYPANPSRQGIDEMLANSTQ